MDSLIAPPILLPARSWFNYCSTLISIRILLDGDARLLHKSELAHAQAE